MMKRSADTNIFSVAQNNHKRTIMDIKPRNPALIPSDLHHLGNNIFVGVNQFLGHTRVHIRKYVMDFNDELQPTKDGVSISPKVWQSLCGELKDILRHKSPEKVFVIEKDLCVSKQIKDDVPVFVFQRLFQRKNCSMDFVPEFVILRGVEFGRLCYSVDDITKQLKEGLVTYSLAYFIQKVLETPDLHFQTHSDTTNDVSELLDSLSKCLCVSITLKIAELGKCFGCRDFYDENFMHDCVKTSRSEKWSAYFEQALYLIDLKDVAKDIVQKNLHLDFNFVLGQQEFFDALDVERLFEFIEKMYVGEEESLSNDLMISCD